MDKLLIIILHRHKRRIFSSPQTADIHPEKGGQSRLFMLRAAIEMEKVINEH
jgi:hypothetical protein